MKFEFVYNNDTQNDEFEGVLKFGMSTGDIESQYQQQCEYMNLYQPTSIHWINDNKYIDFNLNGKYISVIETLFLQLSTDSIFECMHFLSAIDAQDFIKHRFVMKFKIHRDGFVYNLGSRSNMLITLTNCSISNVGNSRNCTSIIALIDSEEDRFTLSLISQRIDLELMFLNILGFVCPKTGHNIGIIGLNVEDTGSLEKTFGKDSASGSYRWHLSIQNKIKHHQQWFTFHLPISIDLKLAHDTWKEFEQTKLLDYLSTSVSGLGIDDLFLCEFNKSKSNDRIREHQKEFKKIRQRINANKFFNHGLVGNWQGAKSIWTFGADGLHLSLRIGNHTVKRFMIFCLDYSEFLKTNPEYIEINHPKCKNYQPMEASHILRHFKDCCKIPFHYDPKNPNRLKITSGMMILFSVRIIIYIL